ncbi:MAG TPA: TetR/AcrR family transcriptional regulator [Streptosporangiaceae bacterium]|nr:TetR/AcrR family transcriptional regulator [Streptosporangiaceae bacterium]
MPAASIRARVRAEMTAEIKAVARRHLETEGANLSLRAVARDMGMVSSAVYRYFASRDELLTALILDAYNALGETVEAADAAVTSRGRLRERWLAAARAIRGWALASPAEYALLYGSPVPGYAAPQDTIAAATRTAAVLVRILADGYESGVLAAPEISLRRPVRADLALARDAIAPGLPEELMLAGMTGWIQLFGTVSFELFGQFNNVIEARAEFFDQQMELMADLMGLPGAPGRRSRHGGTVA